MSAERAPVEYPVFLVVKMDTGELVGPLTWTEAITAYFFAGGCDNPNIALVQVITYGDVPRDS